jgi:hypothetical protein
MKSLNPGSCYEEMVRDRAIGGLPAAQSYVKPFLNELEAGQEEGPSQIEKIMKRRQKSERDVAIQVAKAQSR